MHWDDPEGWDGRSMVGGGFRMGNTCTPVADACWCMAKPIQYCKVKIIIIIKLEKKIHLLDVFTVGSLIYVRPGPGWVQVQLSSFLTNWITICFCTAHYLYIGAISRKREVAKHSGLQNTTLTVNHHCPTVVQLSLLHKNTWN